MSIIVEINQMRNNMGLKPINESDILNEANPVRGIAKLIDDVIKLGKVAFTSSEKSALDKFIVSSGDDFLRDELNSENLKNFVSSPKGKEFLDDLTNIIANEPDIRKKVGYQSYVDALKELPTKKLTKEVGKQIVDIDRLVVDLTEYSKLAIREDPNLLSKIKLAKSKLKKIKDITIPKELDDEILRLGYVIESKMPGLWHDIQVMFKSLGKIWYSMNAYGRLAVLILASSTSIGATIIKYFTPALKQGVCNLVPIPWICDGSKTPEPAKNGDNSTDKPKGKYDGL